MDFLGAALGISICLISLRTNNNRLNKKIFLTLLNDSVIYPNKLSWCSLLRDLLCSLGFYEEWLCHDVVNDKIFMNIVRQRLKRHFYKKLE